MPVAALATGLEDVGDWGVDAFDRDRQLRDEALDDADRDSWTVHRAGSD
jgi:hypothetical protein